MSGRDFRTFLASHQSQIGQPDNRLVTRFLSGQKPLYKEVDYEKLAALTKLKKSSGEQSLKKLEQLTKKNEHSKEQQLLSEHKRIWEKEVRKLQDEELKIENELNLIKLPATKFELSSSSFNKQLYEDIVGYEATLKQDLPVFIERTVQPITDLREDIQYYVETNRDKLMMGLESNDNISNVLESVKQQQSLILQRLSEEEIKVEEELDNCMNGHSFHNSHLPDIKIGIPADLMQSDCPDESLKLSCLAEFESLDEKYVARLESLENKYEDAIRRSPYGGWNEQDHFCFCHFMNQYADVTKNQRKLYMDCLRRILKDKTLKGITNHEEWWLSYKAFRRELKDLFHAWKRDRDDLTLQTTSMFHEATIQYEKKQCEMVDHMKQKFVCNFLHEKLMELQTERLELLKLEEAHCATKEEELQRKMKKKALAEENRRERDKRKIQERKEHQEREKILLSEMEKARMIELQEKRAIQRVHDIERIKYRDEKYQEKLLAEQMKKQVAEEEAHEKERRLQLLKDQVAVFVEDNPDRVLEPTEAYKARIAIPEHEERDVQDPLFKFYTYSVDQIAQDKRVKIENALRRANLHMTDYGRQILSTVPPPTQPRKEMKSTVLRFNDSNQ